MFSPSSGKNLTYPSDSTPAVDKVFLTCSWLHHLSKEQKKEKQKKKISACFSQISFGIMWQIKHGRTVHDHEFKWGHKPFDGGEDGWRTNTRPVLIPLQ